MNLYEIGQIIKNHRIAAKISQEALARAAGVSRATVNGLERGTLNDLGFSKILALLDVLGCSISTCAPAESQEIHERETADHGQSSREISPISKAEVFETRREFLKELKSSRLMKRYAKKYIWWQDAKESLADPLRVVAQTMDLGNLDDVRSLISLVGEDVLRETLKHSAPGWFRPRSWSYWTAVLDLQSELPSQPVTRPTRTFNASLSDKLQHSS